jgi:hypothetical protein
MTEKPTYPIGIEGPVVITPTPGTTPGRIVADETRYTLAEAAVELAKRKCAGDGHVFDVQANHRDEPCRVTCLNECGASWAVDDRAIQLRQISGSLHRLMARPGADRAMFTALVAVAAGIADAEHPDRTVTIPFHQVMNVDRLHLVAWPATIDGYSFTVYQQEESWLAYGRSQ